MRGFRKRARKQRYGSLIDELRSKEAGLLDSGLRGTALLVASTAIVGVIVAAILILAIDLSNNEPSRSEVLAAALTPSPQDNIIRCEQDPIDLDEGTSAVINFSMPELSGYSLSEVQLNPGTVDTPAESLQASVDGTLSTLLVAKETEALEDEPAAFQLRATFHSGDGEYVSICNVRVLPVVLAIKPTGEVSDPDESPTPRATPAPRVIEARLVATPTAAAPPAASGGAAPSATQRPFTVIPTATSTPRPGSTPDPTQTPTPTSTRRPTATPTPTPVTPTATPVTPTATPITPTATPVTPTATPVTPTATPVTPTATPVTPTATPVTPTATPETPTATPEPPTATPEPPTATPEGNPGDEGGDSEGLIGTLFGWLGL